LSRALTGAHRAAQRSNLAPARYPGRAHSARVRISHDAQRVALAYVSSDNLAYEEKRGERLIHKNYASWVNNVLTDLSRGLQIAAIE